MKLASLLLTLTGVNSLGCGIVVPSAKDCKDACHALSNCHAWEYT